MFKCGDVVKDRLSTYNSGIEVLVIIGISESILTDVCNVELKQSEKQFIKDTKKRVIYVCKHITYIDDTMPEEYNNEYISKCLSYSMQNTFTNVTKCFPMDISFMYHIDDFETYLIKNRMLTNLDLHLVSEGQMVQHAKEYYHHVQYLLDSNYLVRNTCDMKAKDFILGRMYAYTTNQLTQFFVPIGRLDDRLCIVTLHTTQPLSLEQLIKQVVSYSQVILRYNNLCATSYFDIVYMRARDMGNVITETPLVVQPNQFIETDLRTDTMMLNKIKPRTTRLFDY